MRVVKELQRPGCKVTIYAWNNRYLVKLESGMLEQTFKIDQLDITSEDDLEKIVDAEFLQQAESRFLQMWQSLNEARGRAEH